ncbi:MAG: ribose-5-phosphate isomerase RpiA [Phototrophicaceae bacterium]
MKNAQNDYKQLVGIAAADRVQDGMVVGLGTGSTAYHMIVRLGERVAHGELPNIWGIPTSRASETLALQHGIPLTTLEAHPLIDLGIDGADEIDPALNLIKGGGGALLREKIIAQACDYYLVIADASKLSQQLGTLFALPVEVVTFEYRAQMAYLERLGCAVSLRLQPNGQPFITDQGNYIVDCRFDGIPNADDLAHLLNYRAGIVEHGMFLGLVSEVLVAGTDGVQSITV